MNKAMENIFTVNLGVKRTERVLVFTDFIRDDEQISDGERAKRVGSRKVAKQLSEVGKAHCHITYMKYAAVQNHGAEPPERVWKAAFGGVIAYRFIELDILDNIIAGCASEREIKAAEVIIKESIADNVVAGADCIIALSNFSTSHTRFRDWLTRLLGVRYASMPAFEEYMLSGVMTADWLKVSERTEALATRMTGGEEVHITTPLGTDIKFSIKGREVTADTGMLTEKGSFGNLPAGEAYTAPLEGTANGKLVIEWAPTRKLTSPITLTVTDGTVVNVEGEDDYTETLRKTLDKDPLYGNIAELGIGTNDKATAPDNILESEKILGTIHIALGDNSTFGGKVSVPFHQDFVFFDPTLTVMKNGEELLILKDGELLED